MVIIDYLMMTIGLSFYFVGDKGGSKTSWLAKGCVTKAFESLSVSKSSQKAITMNYK
jgi:hypothetical protein